MRVLNGFGHEAGSWGAAMTRHCLRGVARGD